MHLNGGRFVIRRGYETARPVASSFCLTVPAYSFVDCIHPLHRLADKHINLPQLLNYFLELVPLVCHPSSFVLRPPFSKHNGGPNQMGYSSLTSLLLSIVCLYCYIMLMSEALRIRSGSFGRVALLDMDRNLVRHAHPHCHVLLKVDGADTQFLVGETVAHLTDESAVLVNAWTPHAYVHKPDRPRCLILALYIEPIWLAEFRKNWASSGDTGFFASATGAITLNIRKLSMALATSMIHAPTDVVEHEKLLGDLMIAVIERFTEWRSVGAGLREASRVQSVDWRVRKAIAMIRREPGEVDNIERLAAEAGMSRANFFRVFEASTGVSPRVFLNVVRLEQAIFGTVNGDMSFGQISDKLGFSTQAHFTRFFRDHAGVAPSQFRSIARIGDIGEAFHL